MRCSFLHRAIWTSDCYCLSSLLSSPLTQVCLLSLSFATVVSALSARLSTIKRLYQSLSRYCWFSCLFAVCRLLLLCSSHVPVLPIPCLLLDKISLTSTPLAPSPSCHSPLLLYAALLHPPDSRAVLHRFELPTCKIHAAHSCRPSWSTARIPTSTFQIHAAHSCCPWWSTADSAAFHHPPRFSAFSSQRRPVDGRRIW